MTSRVISISSLASLLQISESSLRQHLSCLERYRVPYTRKALYRYNYAFLTSLKKFYTTRSHSVGKYGKRYAKIIPKIDSLIGYLTCE